MLFHKLYDSRESYHLTGPILDPRALLRMTAREGRALGNNICFVKYVTDSRNPEARTYRQIPRGYSTKFYTGSLQPRSNTFPFIYHFWQKRYLCRVPLIEKKVTLSNTSLVHWIPFSCCKRSVINMNTALNLPGSFLVLFTAIKCAC